MSSRNRPCVLVALFWFGCLTGLGASPFETIDASIADSVFSPYTFLSGFPAAKEAFASRAEAPSLAGPRLAAIDEGLAANSAARLPDTFGLSLSLSPTVYGGYCNDEAFAGGHLRGALAYYGLGMGYFLAADLGAEYDLSRGVSLEAGDYWLSGAVAGGLVGQVVLDYAILPWVLAARISLPEQKGFTSLSSEPRATLLAETAALTDFVGQARLYSFWGLGLNMDLDLEDPARSGTEGFARIRLTMENRRYQGALYSGWAAYAGGEADYDIRKGEPSASAAAGLRLGGLIGKRAGYQLGFRYRYSTNQVSDIDDGLRCLTASSRDTEGTMALAAGIDFPLSIIRLLPAGDAAKATEFCLKPFIDAAFIQPAAGSGLFDLNHGLLACGLELAASVDKDRIQSFHVAAGFDVSSWLRSGFTSIPTANELVGKALVIEGGFRFVLSR